MKIEGTQSITLSSFFPNQVSDWLTNQPRLCFKESIAESKNILWKVMKSCDLVVFSCVHVRTLCRKRSDSVRSKTQKRWKKTISYPETCEDLRVGVESARMSFSGVSYAAFRRSIARFPSYTWCVWWEASYCSSLKFMWDLCVESEAMLCGSGRKRDAEKPVLSADVWRL